MTHGRAFSVTSGELRELAGDPDISPIWSDKFRVTIERVEQDAKALPTGQFHASDGIPKLVAQGGDLVSTIVTFCESTWDFISDKPHVLLGAPDFNLRPTLEKLAEAIDMIEATKAADSP